MEKEEATLALYENEWLCASFMLKSSCLDRLRGCMRVCSYQDKLG